MQRNLSGGERIIRVIVGLALLSMVSLAFVGPQSLLAWVGLVGLYPVVVGVVGY